MVMASIASQHLCDYSATEFSNSLIISKVRIFVFLPFFAFFASFLCVCNALKINQLQGRFLLHEMSPDALTLTNIAKNPTFASVFCTFCVLTFFTFFLHISFIFLY